MLDETKPRLIVMGGTTEPGVFQIELTSHRITDLNGSIFLARERAGRRFYNGVLDCTCQTVWEYTDKGQCEMTIYRGCQPPVGSFWVACRCIARRIE